MIREEFHTIVLLRPKAQVYIYPRTEQEKQSESYSKEEISPNGVLIHHNPSKVEPHPLPPRRHLRHASRAKHPLVRHRFINGLQLLAQVALVVAVFELRVCVRNGRAGGEPEVLGLVVRGGVLVDVEVFGLAEVGYALVLEGGGLVVGEGEVG